MEKRGEDRRREQTGHRRRNAEMQRPLNHRKMG